MDGHSLNWTPETTRYSRRISPQQWEMHKDQLQQMSADGVTMVNMLAILKREHRFSARSGPASFSTAPVNEIEANRTIFCNSLGQLQRQLTQWKARGQRVNVSSAGLHHNHANQPHAKPPSSARNLMSTNADSIDQRGQDALTSNVQHQPFDICPSKRKRNEASEGHPDQQKTRLLLKSHSTSSSSCKASLLNDIGRTQAELMGLTDIFLTASSAHFDSSTKVGSEVYNLERQHLKDLLQYIREFKQDIFDVMNELKSYINGGDTQRPLHDLSVAPTQVRQSIDLQEHVTQQQRRCTSPTMLSTAGSSLSGLASMKSIQRRSARRVSVPIGRDEGSENMVPFAVPNECDAMSLTNFERVTGMGPCPEDIQSADTDELAGTSMMSDNGTGAFQAWAGAWIPDHSMYSGVSADFSY